MIDRSKRGASSGCDGSRALARDGRPLSRRLVVFAAGVGSVGVVGCVHFVAWLHCGSVSRTDGGNWQTHLDTDTVAGAEAPLGEAGSAVPALTVLAHPDPDRVGERALLGALDTAGVCQLSRVEPYFAAPGSDERRPLADPHLSRQPLELRRRRGGGVAVDGTGTRTAVVIDGEAVTQRNLNASELGQGVTLELARRVVVLLHRLPQPPPVSAQRFGLVGHSPAMVRLEREVARVADLDVPVLLRGETGTGKELVARALHEVGRRRGHPFLAINMAAIPPPLAAAELFGAEKGAYTGSEQRRAGLFQQCDGGTLLLDEIGEMPWDVQALLLRAIELGEVQPVGAERPRRVNVRVIAATDANLDAAVDDGAFRAPLLHRLSGYEIELPPLRDRREDVGRLLLHFLRKELAAVGESGKLADPGPSADPWLPASLVGRLAAHRWPGNVRQLRNVARQLVIASRGSRQIRFNRQLERLLGPAATTRRQRAPAKASTPATGGARYRDPDEVRDEELVAALRAHAWQIKDAALELGVSRTSLYALIDRCPRVRKASDLSRDEIEEARRHCGGSVDAMVDRLEVSRKALKLRMKDLGLR